MSPAGDVVFFDRNTCRIRRLDLAQGPAIRRRGQRHVRILRRRVLGGARVDVYGRWRSTRPAISSSPTRSNARVRRIDAIDERHRRRSPATARSAFPPTATPRCSTIGPPTGIAFDSQGHLAGRGRDAPAAHLDRRADTLVERRRRRNHQRSSAAAIRTARRRSTVTVYRSRTRRCTCQAWAVDRGAGRRRHLPGLLPHPAHRAGRRRYRHGRRRRDHQRPSAATTTGPRWARSPNFNGDTFATQSLFGPGSMVVRRHQGRIIVVDGNNYRVRRFGLAPPPARSEPRGPGDFCVRTRRTRSRRAPTCGTSSRSPTTGRQRRPA